MSLNDREHEEFASHIDNETVYPPQQGDEEGNVRVAHDYGSGSFAEDGQLEVAEDMMGYEIGHDIDGEIGRLNEEAAFIGDDKDDAIADALLSHSIGDDKDDAIADALLSHSIGDDKDDAIADALLSSSPLGAAAAADRAATEIGSAAMFGPTEIGKASQVMPFESFMMDETSFGAGQVMPFESFMMDETSFGAADREYAAEIGAADREYAAEIGAADREYAAEIGSAAMYGPTEIGAAAVVKVIEKARDNRQPAPPMKAVDVDAPSDDDDADDEVTDTIVGVAAVTGNPDPFPMTSALLLRCGAGGEPRYVRVDTEESYKAFRAEQSPEMSALAARVDEVAQKVDAHMTNPEAHQQEGDDLADDIDDLTILGADVQNAEAAKRIELWMPKRFDGLVTAWREGDFVCASLTLPGQDGEVRICTSLEPIRKCVAEMSRHAAEAGVPASTVVGVLPAMGCVLGAGTALKEMAAAAPSILKRPEAARKGSFMVRIEPKTSPALMALAMLAVACRDGNAQACDEWQRLGAASAGPVKQAMMEALQLAKAAA